MRIAIGHTMKAVVVLKRLTVEQVPFSFLFFSIINNQLDPAESARARPQYVAMARLSLRVGNDPERGS